MPLYLAVLKHKPHRIIEYGTGKGHTSFTMGLALRYLKETKNHVGHLFTYDFYKNDGVTHNKGRDYSKTLQNNTLHPWVKQFITVKTGDFQTFCDSPDLSFDMFYLDINNTLAKLKSLYTACLPKLKDKTPILFEGGSIERDPLWDLHWSGFYSCLTQNGKKARAADIKSKYCISKMYYKAL